MSDYKWVRRDGVDQWVHRDVLFDAPYGFAKNCPDCPPPDSTIPEDQIQKPIDPDEVLARIAGEKRDDDAWRRQDGTKYESAVEELNAVWGKGRHDDICEELHDVMDGGKFRRAWEANGGKWGCVRDKKYDRMKEGPRISSNGQMKEALRISRSVNGKKGFATYGD